MEIVGVNWSEKIVIAIVNFVTWFIIIHNNKKNRTSEEFYSSDDNVKGYFWSYLHTHYSFFIFRGVCNMCACVYVFVFMWVCLGQANQTKRKTNSERQTFEANENLNLW